MRCDAMKNRTKTKTTQNQNQNKNQTDNNAREAGARDRRGDRRPVQDQAERGEGACRVVLLPHCTKRGQLSAEGVCRKSIRVEQANRLGSRQAGRQHNFVCGHRVFLSERFQTASKCCRAGAN